MTSRLFKGLAVIILGIGITLHSRNLVALYYVLKLAGPYHGHWHYLGETHEI